jgi:hypothetical protein
VFPGTLVVDRIDYEENRRRFERRMKRRHGWQPTGGGLRPPEPDLDDD